MDSHNYPIDSPGPEHEQPGRRNGTWAWMCGVLLAMPLILGGVSGDLTDLAYLSARRVRIALQGHQPFAAAVTAIHDTLRALRDGTPPGKLTGIADADLMKRVTRDADYTKWTRDFLA